MTNDNPTQAINGPSSTSQARPFSLGLYLLIVFGLSWPFMIAGSMWATELSLRYVLNSTAMIMVTVGTFIAGRYVFRDSFAGAGWQWGKAKHYLAVISLVLLLWVVPTLVGLALGTQSLPGNLTNSQIAWVFVLLFVTLIPGFGEEFGWRGYMLPHLARRLSVRKAVGLHAVIWWAWHLPVFIGAGVSVGAAGAEKAGIPVGLSIAVSVAALVTIGAIPAIMHGIILAYIWSRSRSLAVATVYHAAYDGVRDSLGITVGLGSIAGLWANGVLVILGAVLLWKGGWSNLQTGETVPGKPSS